MKLNIKQSDCRFYVNEDCGKVVCVIPNTRNLVIDFVEDFVDPRVIYYGDKIEALIEMPPSFTGIATCAEGDVFNEEIGKLIAFNKAKRKLNLSFFTRANILVDYLDSHLNKMMDSFNELGEALVANEKRREAKIEEVLNANDNGQESD